MLFLMVLSVYVATFAPTVKVTNPVVKPASSALWMVKLVSLNELSVQINVALLPCAKATRLVGVLGGTAIAIERIMSISSCARMWQCHTNSQPKLTMWLTRVIGSPVMSKIIGSTFKTAPSGIVGSIGRTLLGISKGTVGTIGLKATMVSCSGFTLIV